jgi:hypothetical protein
VSTLSNSTRALGPETLKPRTEPAVVERANRPLLTFVVLGSVASMAIFALAGRALGVPWIIPDELIYSELAKSLADGSLPSIRGEPTLGYGLVYPTIIAPAWAVFDDPGQAYVAAKLINAVVMGLAAFPAYCLARRFVTPTSAAVVAVFSVFIPSMLLSGTLLIEPLLYPVFLVALFAMVVSLQNPTRRNQLLAVAVIGFACLTKPLSIVLAPAYVLAVLHLGLLDRRIGGTTRTRVRHHALILGIFGALGTLVVVGSAFRGDPTAALGVYGVVLGNVDVSGSVIWFVRHLAELDLYVAIVPFAATVLLIALSATRRLERRVNEFAAVSLWTIGGTIGAVATYASKPLAGATGYIPSEARLHERNMFVLVPLLLIGLAVCLERRDGFGKRGRAAALVVAIALPFLLPLGRLLQNANFQALAVIPWTAGGIERLWPLTFVPLALLATFVWMGSPSRMAVRSWALVGGAFLVTTVAAHASMTHPGSGASNTSGIGADRRWIDHAVPRNAEVLALWVAPRGHVDPAEERTIWMSEYFNRTIGDVVEVGVPMAYDLPHLRAVIKDGVLRDLTGAGITARYVLASCRVAVTGRVVASDRRAGGRVYRVPPGDIRVRIASRAQAACR